MKTYALTGGASGIGAAIKQHLVDDGHKVISIDIRDADIESDLSTAEGRSAAIEAVSAAASDGLDGFVACAGVGSHIENLGLIPSVNFFGATDLVEGLRELLLKKAGSVVLISSNSAPMDTDAEYVDALLSGADDELDLLAALDALADYGGGDLITVESDDESIRVWIDTDSDGD